MTPLNFNPSMPTDRADIQAASAQGRLGGRLFQVCMRSMRRAARDASRVAGRIGQGDASGRRLVAARPVDSGRMGRAFQPDGTAPANPGHSGFRRPPDPGAGAAADHARGRPAVPLPEPPPPGRPGSQAAATGCEPAVPSGVRLKKSADPNVPPPSPPPLPPRPRPASGGGMLVGKAPRLPPRGASAVTAFAPPAGAPQGPRSAASGNSPYATIASAPPKREVSPYATLKPLPPPHRKPSAPAACAPADVPSPSGCGAPEPPPRAQTESRAPTKAPLPPDRRIREGG